MSSSHAIAVIIREPGRTPLRLLVTDGVVEVGRDCRGVLLTDQQISRRHLTLEVVGGGLRVVDLGSTNGTNVDGVPLEAPHLLQSGETVGLGGTTIALLDVAIDTAQPSTPIEDVRATSIDMVAAAAVSDPPDLRGLSDDAGTITIVFSDIENSTRRAIEMGDEAWMELLDVHNSIVRRNVARHGGTEIKAQGDGFMLSFPSARRAVRAMIDVQMMLAAHARSRPTQTLRVRVGIHTGEVILSDDGDLFGRHVILASRVASEAVGGEVLVSSLVHELLDSRAEFRFGEARLVQLKGIDQPQQVHPLCWVAVEPVSAAPRP